MSEEKTVHESKRALETMYQRLMERNQRAIDRMNDGFATIKRTVARGTRSFEREFYSGSEPGETEEPTDPNAPRTEDPVSR